MYSEKALLISWSEDTHDMTQKRINLQERLKSVDVGNYSSNHGAYSMLLLWESAVDHERIVSLLRNLDREDVRKESSDKRIWKLPVFHELSSQDLQTVCREKQLSFEEFIQLHSSTTYEVDFIGFLPGFPYLKGLDSRLHLPRKKTPSPQVAAGSVAISNDICGIYPISSPGGWYVIGNCPVPLFDVNRKPPCFLQPGDEVVFEPITLKQFRSIKNQVIDNPLILKTYARHA